MKNSIKSVLSLVSLFMLVGCGTKVSSSSSNNKTSSSSIKVLTKEELLLEYAKGYFVGESYELVEENAFNMYEVPLRTVIYETDLDASFKGCDEEKTNIKYFIYQNSLGEISSILTITLDCNDDTGVYKYSSSDNYTNRIES